MSGSKMLPRLLVALNLCTVLAEVATAANRYWIGGNGNWDAVSTGKWSTTPIPPYTSYDEPDIDDVAIFFSTNSVLLTNTTEQIAGLTMSSGIDLSTGNSNVLSVDGQIQLSDAGTDLFVDPGAIVIADVITINSGAKLTLDAGTLWLLDQSGNALVDVNAGGVLGGNGLILLDDAVSAGTQVFNLDGTLTARSTADNDLLSLSAATLTITVSDPDGLIDLDGNSGASTINVQRNDTLAINGGVLDSAYSGTVNLSPGATFSRNVAWSLDGTLNANTTGTAAATIAGAKLTQTGGSINVDAGESLRLASEFNATGGVIVNNGLIIVDNTATVLSTAQFQTGASGSLEVNGSLAVRSGAGWDWDGNGGSDNVITIGELGYLDASITADDEWDGLMNINGGYLLARTTDGTWGQHGGTINMVGGARIVSTESFVKTGGALHVLPGADAVFDVHSSTWTGGTQDIDGRLRLGRDTTLNGAHFTGDGTLATEWATVVTANTTIDVQTFDWDGVTTVTNQGYTINAGVTLTINSPNFDSGNAMDDPISLAGTGARLIVNGPAQWKMNHTLTVDPGIPDVGATIGGTSRLLLAGVLDANGDATVSAPITFGSGSLTDVAAGAILEVISSNTTYDGGTITGEGLYVPGLTNSVLSNFTITVDIFDFDGGLWTIGNGATLTVDVISMFSSPFDSSILINSGVANVTTGAAAFAMNGRLTLNNTTGTPAVWTGQPLEIGNDAGDSADLFVEGVGISRINSIVNFRSDADVSIASGTTLVLGNSASFNSVSGANNAQFAGAGTLVTNGFTTFFEATTLSMTGGTIDFDGENSDASGNTIVLHAPLVVNAANFESFGTTKASPDTLLVDNEASAGVLTINLDNPNTEWTLDPPGVLQLVNNNTNATLLAGSDINLNGSVFVRGAVQSDARLDIAGSIQKLITGGTLRLNGGDNLNDPNTLVGGSILADVNLAANTGRALVGFGEIRGNISFDGTANLLAKNGTLNLYGAILDVGTIGTADNSGILNVINPWNTNVTDLVQLNGGELRGAAITNAGAAGINGFGLLSARVVNSTRIDAKGGTLVVDTAPNDNDWDGPFGTGSLNAVSGDLEVRDDATFQFTGTASTSANRTLFANGFELEFDAGSTLSLADGSRYRSTNSTHFGGAVMVTGGTASLETDATAVFENGSTTTLTGNLRLENPLTVVEAGASFAGGSSLINSAGRTLRLLDGANVNVLMKNQGTLEFGASPGQVQGFDFQQDPTGLLEIELAGTGLDDFDRMTLIGQAVLGGELNVSLLNNFSPTVGNVFTFLSGVGGVSGTFQTVNLPGLAAGLSWSISYNPSNVQLTVLQTLAGDFNGDGRVDAADYVILRKNPSGIYTPDDYNTWRTHFGQTAGSGSALLSAESPSAAVPEPAAPVLLLLAAAGISHGRRGKAQTVSKLIRA
jgi:hypothetical protein